MGLPEPSDPHGYWAAIKDKSADALWPPDDEDQVFQLAASWTSQANAVDYGSNQLVHYGTQIPNAWRDQNGTVYGQYVSTAGSNAANLATSMRDMAAGADDYGRQIVEAKIEIWVEVATNAALFGAYMSVPWLGWLARLMAKNAAQAITQMLVGRGAAIANGPLTRVTRAVVETVAEATQEAGEEGLLRVANNLVNQATGNRPERSLTDGLGKAMFVGGGGGVLAKPFGELAEPVTRSANDGLRAARVPGGVADHITTGADSLVRNGTTSPMSDQSFGNIYDGNWEEVVNLQGYVDKIANDGLAAGITGAGRSNTTLLGHQANAAIYGPPPGGMPTHQGDSAFINTGDDGPDTPTPEPGQTPAAGNPAGSPAGGGSGVGGQAPSSSGAGGPGASSGVAPSAPVAAGDSAGPQTAPGTGAPHQSGGTAPSRGPVDVAPPTPGPTAPESAGPDQPDADASGTSEPGADRPSSEQPNGDQGETGGTGTGQPEADQPGTGRPEKSLPSTTQPDIDAPGEAAVDPASNTEQNGTSSPQQQANDPGSGDQAGRTSDHSGDQATGPGVVPGVAGGANPVAGSAPPVHTALASVAAPGIPREDRAEPQRRLDSDDQDDAQEIATTTGPAADNDAPPESTSDSAPGSDATPDPARQTSETAEASTEDGVSDAAPSHVEVGGALAASAAGVAEPGAKQVTKHAGPSPVHTRIDGPPASQDGHGDNGNPLTGKITISPPGSSLGWGSHPGVTEWMRRFGIRAGQVPTLLDDPDIRRQVAEASGLHSIDTHPDGGYLGRRTGDGDELVEFRFHVSVGRTTNGNPAMATVVDGVGHIVVSSKLITSTPFFLRATAVKGALARGISETNQLLVGEVNQELVHEHGRQAELVVLNEDYQATNGKSIVDRMARRMVLRRQTQLLAEGTRRRTTGDEQRPELVRVGGPNTGAAGRMRGFVARTSLGREPLTAALATEVALGTRLAQAAGLVRVGPDPKRPGFLRAYRSENDTDGFLFELKAGTTKNGNPAEFSIDDNGVATIVVSESLLPSTSRWMWRVVLMRAIGHELAEINQKLLGNDRPDVLVDAPPGAATGTSAHEHGRQTELRVLEHEHEHARGPLRAARRMALRHHMRLLAEEMRVHPTQKHSQQLKRLLAKDVEEIVDKHFPVGSRASWHRRLNPDPEADGHPSHAWFVGTALATGGLPGLGVGVTIAALANPGLGLAIGVSSLVSALASGLVGRWYAVKLSEAADELKAYQGKELARQDALAVKELYDRLLATMLGTTFEPPESAPQEPEVRGPKPTGVPKWQYRVAARLPSLLGPAAAVPFLWAGPFPDPLAPPGSGATVQFSGRSLAGFFLATAAVAGVAPFLEKFIRRRQVADELAQLERGLANLADDKRKFLIAFFAELHQIMRWIDTIDRVKSQPPQLDAPPPPPARDHGGGPKLRHFGMGTAPGAGDPFLKALADTLPNVLSSEAVATIALGFTRSVVNLLVNAAMDRRHHTSEASLIDNLVDFELEIEHAHSQQEQADLLRKLVEQILPEIHEAVQNRYGTPIPADPNKPVGAGVRRQQLADERAAAATWRMATRAAYAAQHAERARRYAEQARDAAEQAGLRPDAGPDEQGRTLDDDERALLERAQRATEREIRLARRAAYAAERAERALGHRAPQQGPSAQELRSERQDPAQYHAAAAARAAEEAQLAAEHLASVAKAARTVAMQAEINAGKAEDHAAEVAARIAANHRGDPARPVGAHRYREMRRARMAARTARAVADAASEWAADLTERAHLLATDAQELAEHAEHTASAAGVTDAHPDTTAPTGSPTTTVVPPAPPPSNLNPRKPPPPEQRPPAFFRWRWFVARGVARNAAGWVVVAGAHLLNPLVGPIMPMHVVTALGVGAALGAASWAVRWANRRESQRTDDLKEARKRREAWQASEELHAELLDFYLDRFRKEIRVERNKNEKQAPDPWLEPGRPPSLTPTQLPPSHPWFTEYVRFMHRLERGALEREWRPYLLKDDRLAGLARIRKQLEVVDELRAHAEQTGDRRQLDQAITDLDHLWFFYQRLVATTEAMPGPGLTPDELVEERKKVSLDLGRPPKSPGALRPEMADALTASTELTSGRAYYGPDRADSLAAARAATPRDGYYTVHVVATRNGVVINGKHYTIRQFATILRHDPAWHREPIWVTDDRTGLSEAQLTALANELGVKVVGDNTALGNLAADGRTTPAGTAFLAEEDGEQLTASRHLPKRRGQHTVHIRYDLDGPYLGGRLLTEEEFRTLLEHDPNVQGQPVAIAEQTEPLVNSRRTPSGRAYYTAEETRAHAAAQAAPAREGYYAIHIRAGALGVRIGDRWLSIAEFADAVRRDPSWNGEKLFVTDDHTGLTTDQRAELSELLGVEVDSTGTEIADLFAATAATPGGRAAYPPDQSAAHEAAQAAPPREGFYTLHAVLGPKGVRIGDVWLTPPQVAAFLAHDAAYRGQPVWLADAHTGLPVDLRNELSHVLGAEVRSDNADLADVFAESRVTPGGRALYGADELAKHQAAQHAPRKKGYYALHVDGALDAVVIGGRRFSIEQLAAMLHQDPEWNGKALWIADEVGLSQEAMARLSRLTGVRVEGNTRFADARAAGVPVGGGLAFSPAVHVPVAGASDRLAVWVSVEGDRVRIGDDLFSAEEFGTLLSLDPRRDGRPVVIVAAGEPLSAEAAERMAGRLGAPMAVDNRLGHAFADAIVLKDGLALYSPGEVGRLATARATPPRPGHFTLHAVAGPHGIEIGGVAVPLAMVAEFVRRHPGWHGQDLWVTDPHTELTTAQRRELAAALGVAVRTPNGHLNEVLDASRTAPGHRAFPGTTAFENVAALPEDTSGEHVVHVVGDLDGVVIDGRRHTIEEFAEVLAHRPDWQAGRWRAVRIAAEGIGLTAAARTRLEQLLGHPVLTDSRLAEAWLAGRPTPDGRAFSSDTGEGGVPAPPGHRVVRLRAELDSVVIGPVRFTIPELAVILAQDRSARGVPLWITGGPGLTPAALRQLSDLLGVPVRGDGRFTRAMDASRAVPSGRAYFGAAEPTRHAAARAFPADPRLHVIHVEGHGDQIRVGDLWFSMRELAYMIRHDPAWDGRDLLVVADGVGLDTNALRELGADLGVRVQPQAPALADLLALGEVTPGGRALHTDEALRAAARAVAPVPGHFVLDVLGDVDAIVVGGVRLDMRAVAALVANDPAWQGQALLVNARGVGLSQTALRELAGHLAAAGVPVRATSTATADALAARVRTPGGSAYYAADHAASRAAAQRAPRVPGHHLVHVIATPAGVRIGDRELTITEFAAVLRHDPAWRGKDLWITDFLTGLTTAQRVELSTQLGVAVRSDNTDVADVLAASRVVAGDRVFGQAEPTVAPEPGVHTLHGTWDLDGLVVDGTRLAVERIAMLVQQDPLWDGTSPVRVAGEIGLSPQARRELANLLGVPVLGESPVADALAASSAVVGGRSLLPGGALLAPPAPPFHTLHMIGEGNLVWFRGRAFTMAELAALVRHDPFWGGKPLRLAVAGPGLDPDAVAELGRLVGVPVEVAELGHAPGDRFHSPRDGLPTDPIPMNLGTVHSVAEEYGIPLDNVPIALRPQSTVFGDAVTKADGTVNLFPGAFMHGRAYLAIVLRHETGGHVDDEVPTTAEELAAQEEGTSDNDDAWWRDHPLNPEPKGPALYGVGFAGDAAPAIPFSRQSLAEVAEEYGLPLSGVAVHLSLDREAEVAAATNESGDIVLYGHAFSRGKEFLAFVLQEQLTHVERLRTGEPYPSDDAEFTAWEQHAHDQAQQWRNALPHDLRPSPGIPGHAVQGGRSYLPYGALLAPPTDGAHTVHVATREGRVEIDGVVQNPRSFANMLGKDPGWRPGMPVIIVVPHRGRLDSRFVAGLEKLLDTRVTVAAPTPVSYPRPGTPPADPIPATLDKVREVAAKYGVDLTGIELVRNNENDGPISSDREERLVLHDTAFEHGEAHLALLLYSARVQADHGRATTVPEVDDHVAEWWHWHPLNPDNATNPDPRPFVPSVPGPSDAYILPVSTDGDGVLAYGGLVRLDINTLATHIGLDPRWGGRTVHLAGEGPGLSPEKHAELERLLGVRVQVRRTPAHQPSADDQPLSATERFYAASHPTPGGRSFLPLSSTPIGKAPSTFTVYLEAAGDVIVFDGHRRTMAELAAVLHLDPRWSPGRTIDLQITGYINNTAIAELEQHLGARVSIWGTVDTTRRRHLRPPRFDAAMFQRDAPLPVEKATIARVASVYGIDVPLGLISIEPVRGGAMRNLDIDGIIRVDPRAFQHGEEFLAKTLFQAEVAEEISDGERVTTLQAFESYALVAEWWAHHPLNPDNTTPGPYLPALAPKPFVLRLKVVGDGDGVLVYGRIRLTIPELARLLENDPRWDGRDVELIGPGGLNEESRAELARLLGVRVSATDAISEALAASHGVPGGRSFLEGGAQLIPGTASVHTIHVEFRHGLFVVGDRYMSPAEFALVLKHDPDWRGKDLLIVNQGEAIDAETAQQLVRVLAVPVTVMLDEPDPDRTTYRPADTLDRPGRPTDPITADMATVRRVAGRYGIDISGLDIELKHRLPFGEISNVTKQGTLRLSRKAFWHGEAGLAYALYEGGLYRTAQLLRGQVAYQVMQADVIPRLAEWWLTHPLNPENLAGNTRIPSAPAPATIHRLHVRSDFDALYVHGHTRVPVPVAIERIRNDPAWAGRDISLTGGGGLTPESRALMERSLGVRVSVSVAAGEALAASTAVPHGRSFLEGGTTLVEPRTDAYTYHLDIRDGQVHVGPHKLDPDLFAMIVRHDPDYDGGPIVLATRGMPLGNRFMDDLRERLGTTVTQKYVLSNRRGAEVEPTPDPPAPPSQQPANARLPVSVRTALDVAEKYGINLGARRVNIRSQATTVVRNIAGVVEMHWYSVRPDGSIVLGRDTFTHNETFLARKLYGAWYMAELYRLRGKPRTINEDDALKAEVIVAGDIWWGRHPRNPDNTSTALFIPTAPADPTVHRLDVRVDGDGVIVYDDIRLTIDELVNYLHNDPRWRGRTVQIGGEVGLDPVVQARMSEALGVEVIGPVGLPRELSGRTEVPGGVSLLPGGAVVADPVPGAFTVHAKVVGDRVMVDGTPVDAAGFATLVVNDPAYEGGPVALATEDDVSQEFLDEIRRHLPVDLSLATVRPAEDADSESATTPAPPSRLEATVETLRAVAAEYGVDLTDVDLVVHDERRVNEDGTPVLAETTPDGTVHFYADAFDSGPGGLARIAYRQWVQVEQIRVGQWYPGTFTEQEWLALEGDARADAWWAAHPLNPDQDPEPYLPTAPSDPDVYRIHVIGDFDGVYIYGHLRISGDDLILMISLDPKWAGRKIVITGPVGVSPQLRDEIAELTGVEVEADTSAAEALAASTAVPGGTSFLPNGRRLAFPTQGAHTVHIRHRNGRFLANGAEHAPIAVAAMIRRLLDRDDTHVVLATDTPVDQAVVDEIARLLGVTVTTARPASGPGTLNRVVLPHEFDDPDEQPLPATVETAYEVAEEYGAPVHGTKVVVLQEQYYDEYGTPAQATIDENGVLYLYPEAFAHGKDVLAVAMYHELMHIEQLRTGQPYPEAPPEPEEPAPGQPRRPVPIHDIEWMELEAYQLEEAWWNSHPLNPEREQEELDLPMVPAPDPDVFRVFVTGDFDGGYVYGNIRLTTDELIEHLLFDARRNGRPVMISGPVGLSPAAKAAIEDALGVEVIVDTSAAEAFEASHTVPGGQSFLDDGGELVPAVDGAHTVHIRHQDGRFIANGAEHAPIAVAAMVGHHPEFDGKPVVLATDTPVEQAVVDELSRRLGVPVTAVTPDTATGLYYHEDTSTAPDEPLPMTYDMVYEVADEFGVDLAGVPVVLADRQVGGALAETLPDGTLVLYPKVFGHGRPLLARALNHDGIHVDQLRMGRPYPRTVGELVAWEEEAYAVGATWWARHPLNPENRNPFPLPAPAVSDPAVYRLHDVGDIDGVLLYNRQRVSITTLAMLIRNDPLWGRREIVFTGPNGLSAESQAKLARLLGVPVTVDTSVADALEGAHAVPGGTSFLPDGRQLLLPVEGAHTIHVAVRGDRFLIGGAFFTPAAVTTMIRHDPRWAGGLVVIATEGEPLSEAVVAEISKALGAPVTTAWTDSEHETPVLLTPVPPTEPLPGKALPVGMNTVRRVAAKFGIDLTGVHIGVDRWQDMRGEYTGASLPSNPANPRAAAELLEAFRHGEEALAQVLHRAWVTVEQMRTGQATPEDVLGAEWREAEVVSRTRAWWAAHPLNPANTTFGPYLPTAPAEPDVHRIHVVADFDAVVVFGDVRLTMAELADLVRDDPSWQGRTLRITGPGGLTPEAKATLERLLGVAVEVDTRATEALAASHPVHGGRSFLPEGRQVAWAKPGTYTVHVLVRGGRFVIDGVEYDPAGFAVILRHDDEWHGEELVVATEGEPLSSETAEELGLHLNTPPVTTEFRDEADQHAAGSQTFADRTTASYGQEVHFDPGRQVAEQLRSFLDQSTPIRTGGQITGRMFFAPGDPLLTDRLGVAQDPDVYTLDLHAVQTPQGTMFRIGPFLLGVEHLTALLDADPNYHGQRIRLLACDAARGEDSAAQRLADHLGVPVEAPTAHFGVYDDGTPFVSDMEIDANGIARPKVPPTGTMRTFHPRENASAHLAPDLVAAPVYVGSSELDHHNPWRLRGGTEPADSAGRGDEWAHAADRNGVDATLVPDPANMSADARRDDILYGTVLGNGNSWGGHRHNSGVPNKKTFPATWDDDMIIHAIVDAARNPAGTPEYDPKRETWTLIGERHGVRIKVVVQPDGMIRSGEPTRGDGVRRNDENGVSQPLPASGHGPYPDPGKVFLTDARRTHILGGDGDGEGGGHRHGSGVPGKTTFPRHWSDDKIIDELTHVAGHPGNPPEYNEFQDNWRVVGTRDGVDIEVIVRPDGMIITGYPTGGEGVHYNDENGDPQPRPVIRGATVGPARLLRALPGHVSAYADRHGIEIGEARQQFVLQRVLARVFTASPEKWLIKGGQSLLARWPDSRPSDDIDLVSVEPGTTAEDMAADYLAALRTDLGDHLTFTLIERKPLMNGEAVRFRHMAYLGVREVGEVSVDLVPSHGRAMWADPEMVPFPEHVMPTGFPGENPRLRVKSLTDSLVDKIAGMYKRGTRNELNKCAHCLPRMDGVWVCAAGDLPNRAQDVVDTVLIAQHWTGDATSLQTMVADEIRWRASQGEPIILPNEFLVPNPEYLADFAEEAARTPGVPYRSLEEALPLLKRFLDPVLDRTRTSFGTWSTDQLQWVDAGSRPLGNPVYQRILVVAHVSGRATGLGGLPVASAELTKALSRLPHTEVTLLVVGETEDHGDARVLSIEPDGKSSPRVRLLNVALHEDPSSVPGLPDVFSHEFDLVIGHSRFSSSAAMAIRNRWYPSARLAYVLHMPVERYGEVQGWTERAQEYAWLEAKVMRNADLVVGIGPLLTDTSREMVADGAQPSFHELIPGVELLGSLTDPPPLDTVNLLFSGRVSDAVKGYPDLLATVARLHGEGMPVRLRVRGVAPADIETEQAHADETVGAGIVEVLPYSTNNADLLADYQWAHAAVMPSVVEGFGLVAAEAAAHGRPVLVNEESGAARFFSDGDRIPTRLGAPSVVADMAAEDRVTVWADAITDLYNNYDQRLANARELSDVLRQYTWDHAAQALSEAATHAFPFNGQVTLQHAAGTLSRSSHEESAAVDEDPPSSGEAVSTDGNRR